MPEALRVVVDGAAYVVDMSIGGLETLAARVDALAGPGRLHVLSDSNVHELYGDGFVEALAGRGRWVKCHVFEAGEASKSLATVSTLWDALLSDDIDRGDTVVAFGGGVVGDVAGFVASTVLRGIDVVQVPTTLLAMADASIGGKTGINHASGKNLVGSFHHPVAVLAWLPALRTQSDRELRSGLAEVVKCALIAGEQEFRLLEDTADALSRREDRALRDAVWMAAEVKAKIVTEDAREKGVRRILNFGHTFGHAIEHASGYGEWTHGEAVAVGMRMACQFGADAGYCGSDLPERVSQLLHRLNLPTENPSLSIPQWMAPIARDKKRSGQDLSLVICRRPGLCEAQRISMSRICGWLADLD